MSEVLSDVSTALNSVVTKIVKTTAARPTPMLTFFQRAVVERVGGGGIDRPWATAYVKSNGQRTEGRLRYYRKAPQMPEHHTQTPKAKSGS